jgi:hypothetical protein
MKAARLAPLLLLLLSASVRAQDACLAGASTLGDQRALRTLRADTEAACPCAVATRRGEYQRCARGVADAAIAGGTCGPSVSGPRATSGAAPPAGRARVPAGGSGAATIP